MLRHPLTYYLFSWQKRERGRFSEKGSRLKSENGGLEVIRAVGQKVIRPLPP